jgi:hypothetical protein
MKSILNYAFSASGTISRSGTMVAIVRCFMMRKEIWKIKSGTKTVKHYKLENKNE